MPVFRCMSVEVRIILRVCTSSENIGTNLRDNFHAKLSEFKRDVIVTGEEKSIMRLWERLLQERNI